MSLAETADPVVRCPDRSTLLAFNLGKLPAPTLEAIGQHVSTCGQCDDVLSELQEESDSLIGKLRRCQEPATVEQESACAEMEERARAIDVSPGITTGQATTGHAPPAEEAVLPAQIGPYLVLERIGRGGMGVVYKARQTPVNRLVAVKMISAGAHATAHMMSRFQVEGQAIARLQHANVIQIYDFGQHEGLPYFSMELAEGGSLAKRLANGPLPLREAAEVLKMLAQAVQYAHEQKVLHRDLKPSNILMGAGGLPKISDFGLAKLLDAESGHTLSEAVLGTPAYMAPEQAEGKTSAVGPAADIYALGVILYEALTGRPPFKGADKAEVLRMVRLVEPEPPSRRRREVPPDLEAVCLKCLEKAPERRYATAEMLAQDLDRWLTGEPTVARPRRWPNRVWRRVRRQPLLVGLTLALLGGLVALQMSGQDPDQPLRRIAGQLAQGQKVALLGAQGKPAWFRVRRGKEKTQTAVAQDGTFSVSAWGEALIELLPEVPYPRYRLRAQIRHLKSLNHGSAGLYVGHATYPGPYDDMQIFTYLRYNEAVAEKDLHALIPFKGKPLPPVPKGNRVRLGIQVVGKGPVANQDLGYGGNLDAGALFQPQGPLVGPWREFAIVVTPERIAAVLDPLSPLPVGEVSARQLEATMAGSLANLVKQFPAEPLFRGIPASFQPRGGIGLYLMNGDACFREVEIAPLGEAD